MMTIQFNTDHNIKIDEKHRLSFKSILTDALYRFRDHISHLEVHFSDEDGNKNSQNDIRCLLEARLVGYNPIIATNNANTNELAIDGAIEILKTSLNTHVNRLNNH